MSLTLPQGTVIAVVGATATGKSDLAQGIAMQLDGEIVSADSMQVYKGMDIGTAKVPLKDRSVEYHGIDLIEPNESYSAALFQIFARKCFDEVRGRGHVPVLVGGTGFYVRAAIDGYDFASGEQDDNPIRQKYEEFLEENGVMALWNLLESRDPDSASTIHPNNAKRVLRALEMNENGDSYAERARNLKNIPQIVDAVMIGISFPREELYRRIETRVDAMRESGLVGEVEDLLANGFRDGLTAPSAIGYKEIVAAIDGECTMNEAFDQIKLATRRYAKRQETWFRKDKRICWIMADGKSQQEILDEGMRIIERMVRSK